MKDYVLDEQLARKLVRPDGAPVTVVNVPLSVTSGEPGMGCIPLDEVEKVVLESDPVVVVWTDRPYLLVNGTVRGQRPDCAKLREVHLPPGKGVTLWMQRGQVILGDPSDFGLVPRPPGGRWERLFQSGSREYFHTLAGDVYVRREWLMRLQAYRQLEPKLQELDEREWDAFADKLARYVGDLDTDEVAAFGEWLVALPSPFDPNGVWRCSRGQREFRHPWPGSRHDLPIHTRSLPLFRAKRTEHTVVYAPAWLINDPAWRIRELLSNPDTEVVQVKVLQWLHRHRAPLELGQQVLAELLEQLAVVELDRLQQIHLLACWWHQEPPCAP